METRIACLSAVPGAPFGAARGASVRVSELVGALAGEASRLLERVGGVLLGPIPHCQVPAVLAEADIGLAPYARGAPDWFAPLKVFEGYGERPEELSWYLATAILRRSPYPSRRQEERLPERIEAMLTAAEGVCE